MRTSELTLQNVRRTATETEREVRVSDFLSKEQERKIKETREKALVGMGRQGFDEVDAYSAEILARFGFEAWQAWQEGQVNPRKMMRMVLAERARGKRELIGLEALIVAAVAGANHPNKRGRVPKSLKNAIKILKAEMKAAKGVS